MDFNYFFDNGGFSKRITEIPYTELPMETNGCPPLRKKKPSSHNHRAMSFRKQRRVRSAVPGDGSANSSSLASPLISSCDIMPLVVNSLNSVPKQRLMCVVSPSPNGILI